MKKCHIRMLDQTGFFFRYQVMVQEIQPKNKKLILQEQPYKTVKNCYVHIWQEASIWI
jgi:hypothetical protein